MNPDLFQDVVVDPQRRAQLQERAPARFFYVIHFTPRSGSSWLTDVIAATRQLSAANEAFNPGFIPRIAQAVHATDLDDYFQMLIRVYNTKGVYGTEVTAHQINAVPQNPLYHKPGLLARKATDDEPPGRDSKQRLAPCLAGMEMRWRVVEEIDPDDDSEEDRDDRHGNGLVRGCAT